MEDIRLFNIGDVHRGDEGCNVRLFHKAINEVKNGKNTYWVSTGDLLNVALKTSLSDCYKSKNLAEEFKLIINELSPIAEKCLGLVESNHHRRFDKATGLSLDEQICDKLQIPFLGKLGVINVMCKQAAYYIVMHHGVGSGRKRGAKTNNTAALGELIPGADIYFEGHTHSFDHFIDEVPYIDKKRKLLRYHPASFVVTGHFLEWEASYAMDYKLPPRPQGASFIELTSNTVGNSSNKKVKADLYN